MLHPARNAAFSPSSERSGGPNGISLLPLLPWFCTLLARAAPGSLPALPERCPHGETHMGEVRLQVGSFCSDKEGTLRKVTTTKIKRTQKLRDTKKGEFVLFQAKISKINIETQSMISFIPRTDSR